MKLFLCSHFSSVGSLIKEEIENKKVAFIPTASLREGYTGYVGSARKLFKKLGAIVTEIDISTEAYSTIQSVFEDADVIYFTGGNSFFLIDQLRKTGTDELLKKELAKEKLMIGESAGAIICAPSIQYIEQMDEKPEDYSQEDDAGLYRQNNRRKRRNEPFCPRAQYTYSVFSIITSNGKYGEKTYLFLWTKRYYCLSKRTQSLLMRKRKTEVFLPLFTLLLCITR